MPSLRPPRPVLIQQALPRPSHVPKATAAYLDASATSQAHNTLVTLRPEPSCEPFEPHRDQVRRNGITRSRHAPTVPNSSLGHLKSSHNLQRLRGAYTSGTTLPEAAYAKRTEAQLRCMESSLERRPRRAVTAQNFIDLNSSRAPSRNMEVDGHPPPDRRTAGEAHHAAAEVTVINGETDARFPKVFREECMRLSRPQRYDGRGDAQVLDEFVAGLRIYLHFYTESEEQRVLLVSCRPRTPQGGRS